MSFPDQAFAYIHGITSDFPRAAHSSSVVAANSGLSKDNLKFFIFLTVMAIVAEYSEAETNHTLANFPLYNALPTIIFFGIIYLLSHKTRLFLNDVRKKNLGREYILQENRLLISTAELRSTEANIRFFTDNGLFDWILKNKFYYVSISLKECSSFKYVDQVLWITPKESARSVFRIKLDNLQDKDQGAQKLLNLLSTVLTRSE